MAITITDADNYIGLNFIDAESWQDSETTKKQRYLNVANRILTDKFAEQKYIIPNNAVFEYAAVLAIAFNDVNKLRLQGIMMMSSPGVATFQYDNPQSIDDLNLEHFIPLTAYKMIEKENGVTLNKGKNTVKRTVL